MSTLDARGPVTDRSGAAQLERRRRRRRSLERDRPDRPHVLLHVLAVLAAAARTAARAATTRRPATQTSTVSNSGEPAGQRYTTDAPIVIDPNVPPKAADGTQPPNALYIGGTCIGRSLNRGTRSRDQPDRRDADRPDRSDHALPGPVPADEIDIGLYTNLYGAVTALAPAKSADAGPVRAGDLRGHGHRPRVEDDATRARRGRRMQGLPSAG